MSTLLSKGSMGGMMLMKMAPSGTPLFDIEAPGVGQHGGCTACTAPSRMVYPVLAKSGLGDRAYAEQYLRSYSNTSTR